MLWSIAAATGGKPRKYAKEFESLTLRHESLILLDNLVLQRCNPTDNPTARYPDKAGLKNAYGAR
jgi:hypothetical protein